VSPPVVRCISNPTRSGGLLTTVSLSRRFLESTRGRIVGLLRRSARTVEDLAQALELTDNAVRSHLATLERDGFVQAGGQRRGPGAGKPATVYELQRRGPGAGKPATVYELAPEAEPQLSSAYAPVLRALMDELAERLTPDEREVALRAVGRRLAAATPTAPGDRQARLRAAVALLGALGGDAEIERGEGGADVVRGCGCPLSAVTATRPEACRAVETLLEEVVGAPVRERCDRGERPRCRFVVEAAP
jgi:predicted ArsR family transcriptional regulator